MSEPAHIPRFGTWAEERLWVLNSLADLRGDVRRQAEDAAAVKGTFITRALKDLDAAHIKIRALELRESSLVTKNWVTTSALAVLFAVLFEIVKAWVGRH